MVKYYVPPQQPNGPAIEKLTVVEKFQTNENSIENTPMVSPEAKQLLFDYECQTQDIVNNVRGGGGELPGLHSFIFKMYLQLAGLISMSKGFAPNNPLFLSGQIKPRVSIQQQFIEQNAPASFKSTSSSQKSHSLQEIAENYCEESKEYDEDFYPQSAPPRFDEVDRPTSAVEDLMENPQTGSGDRWSVNEGRSAIQAEKEGLIENARRLTKAETAQVNIDYSVTGPGEFRFADIKHMLSQRGLALQNQDITLPKACWELGESIAAQKSKFIGGFKSPSSWAPKSTSEVAHVVDLCYLETGEKGDAMINILAGASSMGINDGIFFINQY